MFIDQQLLMHDDTAVTTAAEYKGDSLTMHTADELDREGKGEGLEIIVQITETFAGGTNAFFALITAPEATLATDATQSNAGLVPTAQLVAGKKFRIPMNMNVADTAGYFGVMCTSTGTHSAGKFSAWVQRVGEDQDSY